MANCCYDVIHSYQTQAKCGNWDASQYDGEIGETGWFYDLGNGDALSSEYPRTWMYRSPSEHLMDTSNVADRWMAVPQHRFGDVDSPILYPLPHQSLTGWASGWKGHAQYNPYVPEALQYDPASLDYPTWPPPAPPDLPSPLDVELLAARHAATLRLDRHTVESIIESAGGSQMTLYPWIPQLMPPSVENPNQPDNFYMGSEELLRAELAMLRGKNIPGLISWTGADLYWTGAADRCYVWRDGWAHTVDVVSRVYAARVASIDTSFGAEPTGYPGHDVLMLEYTLKEEGEPYVVELEPSWYSIPPDPPEPGLAWQQAGIDVDFDLSMTDVNGDPVDFTDTTINYEINVEDAAGAGAAGYVLAYDWKNHDWAPLSTREGPDYYPFITPDGTSRRTLLLENTINFVEEDSETEHLYHIRLRWIHAGIVDAEGTPLWVSSKFDLLQIIPYRIPVPSESPPELMAMPHCDIDYDGVIGSRDVDIFCQAWENGEKGADLNMDGEVDSTDVAVFEASYIADAP